MRVSSAILPLAFALVAAFQDPIYDAVGLKGVVPESWALFFFAYGVVAPILVMSLIDGGPSRIVSEIGLNRDPVAPMAFALLVTSPALVGFAFTAVPNAALNARDIVMGGLVFPAIEEAFFRGFLFGQLYRRAEWGFWPAALVPAFLFALGHIAQSNDPAEMAGILAITGLGSIVFSYVFVQWGGNIWAPFACHACLNIWWSVFAIDDTALGGQAANVFRFAAVALATGFCFLAPRFGWLAPLKRGG